MDGQAEVTNEQTVGWTNGWTDGQTGLTGGR